MNGLPWGQLLTRGPTHVSRMQKKRPPSSPSSPTFIFSITLSCIYPSPFTPDLIPLYQIHTKDYLFDYPPPYPITTMSKNLSLHGTLCGHVNWIIPISMMSKYTQFTISSSHENFVLLWTLMNLAGGFSI